MKNEIKRHFYNGVDYILDEEKQEVRLQPEFYKKLQDKKLFNRFGFKKVGGSSIGEVLEVDQYKSLFNAFCKIMWLGMPILDRKYVDAGIAIEPKVIKAIEEKSQKEIETYDPFKYNFDFFSDKDDVVGGLPDGYIKEDNLIIEIKTTGEKNLENWNKWGIPQSYLKQAQLYSYLIGAKEYAIVATFLKEEDYVSPKDYPIRERKIKTWRHSLDMVKAEDDINKVKEWYYSAIGSAVSPKYDISKDYDLVEWLRPRNKNEWLKLQDKWIQEGKING